jgi:hypothetical protein
MGRSGRKRSALQDVPGRKVNILGAYIVDHSKGEIIYIYIYIYICSHGLKRTIWLHAVHCTEQHAISSLELQSALMLTVEFSKIGQANFLFYMGIFI